jgi:hypothetical protein
MLNEVEHPAATNKDPADLVEKFEPTVEYSGKVIFKSTLVSELNGNPFLSKDRLTRIRNSVYFNNAEDYRNVANSSSSYLLGLGSDCGIYFVQKSSLNTTSAVQTTCKRSRNSSSRSEDPTNVSVGTDSGSWWIGQVQKMRRRVGTKWGVSRNPIDLMNQFTRSKGVPAPTAQGLLNWFSKGPRRNKFKYNATNTQWIDVEAIISTVTMKFNATTGVYTISEDDRVALDEFLQTQK